MSTAPGPGRGTEFDQSKARTFWPRADFTKTAIRVDLADQQAVTELATSFGTQTMVGSFYLVADGDSAYGAALDEFERSHRQVSPTLWVRRRPVSAYQVAERCEVVTRIGDHEESRVEAQRDDWLVKQPDGELMVLRPAPFEQRYTTSAPQTP